MDDEINQVSYIGVPGTGLFQLYGSRTTYGILAITVKCTRRPVIDTNYTLVLQLVDNMNGESFPISRIVYLVTD